MLLVILLSPGCTAADQAIGVWENKSLPLKEIMTIQTDGTYTITHADGTEISSGRWKKVENLYQFNDDKSGKTSCAEIFVGARAQSFLIFENVTYLKV